MFHPTFIRKSAGAAHSQTLDDGCTGHLVSCITSGERRCRCEKTKKRSLERFISRIIIVIIIFIFIITPQSLRLVNSLTTGQTFNHSLRPYTTGNDIILSS